MSFPRRHRTLAYPSESRDRLLLLLLIELWVLNVADLALTRYSLWLGFATESNGVMDYFLRAGTVPALAFKVGIVTVGALLLWRLRVYRVATVAAALLASVLATVVAIRRSGCSACARGWPQAADAAGSSQAHAARRDTPPQNAEGRPAAATAGRAPLGRTKRACGLRPLRAAC